MKLKPLHNLRGFFVCIFAYQMHPTELLYQIALKQIQGVGDVIAKNLIAYCGSASQVFTTKKEALLKIPQVGEYVAQFVLSGKNNTELFKRAEEELKFIEEEKITPLFFTEAAYPAKLKHCADAPLLLFFKGTANLNQEKIVAVIGTRNATQYGIQQTEKLLAALSTENILVVSGLAYGIDYCAHKAALANNLDTVGVLAHGLDNLYPSVHTNVANKMIHQGGLLTEFISKTNPDKENFPKRNRIIAGLSDAVVVVESKKTGGALITAEIAHSYNRDVFAFPGKAEEECSAGCNMLIKRNKACMIENAADLLYAMGWEQTDSKKIKSQQFVLPVNLSEDENLLINLIKDAQPIHVDDICAKLQLTPGKASGLLLQLEFSNLIKSLPGKLYTLN
ncbi:MAG: DNA-processing protein DprA [Bacteroidia bacterium]